MTGALKLWYRGRLGSIWFSCLQQLILFFLLPPSLSSLLSLSSFLETLDYGEVLLGDEHV